MNPPNPSVNAITNGTTFTVNSTVTAVPAALTASGCGLGFAVGNATSADTLAVEIEAPEVRAVARSSMLWPGAAPRVYVEKEARLYEPRTVKLGRAGDTDWEVLDGLSEGERVVASGGVLLDGQAQLNNKRFTKH